jgi:acetyl esterase/lipase
MDRRSFLLAGATAAVSGIYAQTRPQDHIDDDVIFLRDVRYRPGSSEAWKLDFAMPKAAHKATPAIVMIHGGGWIEGDKSSFDHYCIEFAKLGFFCATINYRLAPEAPYPAAIEDCKCAMRWLRAHAGEYNVDASKVTVYGNSAGGHLALMVGMAGRDAELEGDGPYQNESSLAQSVISDSGPTILDPNESATLRRDLALFLAGPAGTLNDRARKGSPVNYIGAHTPPLLLLYGTADNQVTIRPVDAFVVATQKAGLQNVTYIRLAGVDHCPYSIQKIAYLQLIVVDFLKRTLMNDSNPGHPS